MVADISPFFDALRPDLKAILFDLDGTLNDTFNLVAERMAAKAQWLLGRASLPITRQLILAVETPANALITLSDRLHLDQKLAKRHRDKHNKEMTAADFRLIAGIEPMLLALAQHYPLAIVTTRGHADIDRFLSFYPALDSIIPVRVGSDDTTYLKPHPEPVRYAAAKLGVSAENCLMVGDTTVDMRSGKKARAATVGVLSGFGRRRELKWAGADVVINSSAELHHLILGTH